MLLKVGSPTQLLVTRDWYVKYLDLKVVHENPGRNAFLAHGPGARLALHTGEPAGNPPRSRSTSKSTMSIRSTPG